MPNSDTQDGVHNKMTKEIKYTYTDGDTLMPKTAPDGSAQGGTDEHQAIIDKEGTIVPQSFSGNVETAKTTMLHADALTNNDTNATQVEYAITADGNGLKFTIAFGTKGAGTAEDADWADLWTTTKSSLIGADKWVKPVAGQYWDAVDATPHLF
tara:strand:+ start:426 stop:887 length:462 start_codon:yes stop_codon:yes gene_type:complete